MLPNAQCPQVDGRFPEAAPRECGQFYSDDKAQWGASSGTSKLCSGLFLLQPGNASLDFVDTWAERLANKQAGAKNQPHYNAALAQSNLSASVLPCDLFPNGYRYASEVWRKAQGRPPVMVHNNWIVSALKKRKRFKEWGLWRPTLSAVEAQAAAKAEAGTPQAWAAAQAEAALGAAAATADAADATAALYAAAAREARAGVVAKRAAAAKSVEEATVAAEVLLLLGVLGV